MYTIDSTHGLRASAHTADQAHAILGRHLAAYGRDNDVGWLRHNDGRRTETAVSIFADPPDHRVQR